MTSLLNAWRAVDDRRAAAVARRMRRAPVDVASVVRQTEADGQAWVTDLAEHYGGSDTDDIARCALEVDRSTGHNLLVLAQVGALNGRDLVCAAISAGFAAGYFVRAEADRAAAAEHHEDEEHVRSSCHHSEEGAQRG